MLVNVIFPIVPKISASFDMFNYEEIAFYIYIAIETPERKRVRYLLCCIFYF